MQIISARRIGAIFFIMAGLCSCALATPDSLTDGSVPVIAGSVINSSVSIGPHGPATFEDYPEGQNYQPTLTDPISGIRFSKSTALGGNFTIEYGKGSNWTAPMFQDNRYLSANSYIPGNTPSMPGQFGFTATLPELARSVELDLAGAHATGTYSVSLVILDINGVEIGSRTVGFTTDLPEQYHLSLDSAGINIASFQIITGTNGFDAVDNINFVVPEPAGSFIAAIGLLSALTRRMRGERSK